MAETVTTVFWDASSAEPALPEAQQAWLAAQAGGWGDPSRLHRPGRLAAQALDAARQLVADALGARPDEVVFPSSGFMPPTRPSPAWRWAADGSARWW